MSHEPGPPADLDHEKNTHPGTDLSKDDRTEVEDFDAVWAEAEETAD